MKTWLLMLVAAVVAYGASLHYGFSQDDFFHLTISQAHNLREFLSFFNLKSQSWVFYRPLSTQVWYWLFTSNLPYEQAALPMHIASLLLHTTNAYLVTLLLKKVFKLSPKSAVVGGVLYVTASIHFLSLFYIGATQQLLVTFFSLIALLTNISGKYLLSCLFLLFSLLSKEIGIRFVPFLFIIRIIKGDSWKVALRASIGPIILTVLYLIVRFASGVSTPPEYNLDFSPLTTAASVMWYGLFSLGAPENLLGYGLSAGRINWGAYIVNHSPYGVINIISMLVLGIIIFFKKLNRKFVLSVILWLVALSPVILLPTHRYAHYLDLSLIPIFGWVFSASHKKISKIIFTIVFLCAAFSAQLIDRQTHWIIGRSELAKSYTEQIQASGACEYKGLVFEGTENELKEISYVLMNEHGPRHICNNKNLEVYYGTVDVVPSDNLFVIKLK